MRAPNDEGLSRRCAWQNWTQQVRCVKDRLKHFSAHSASSGNGAVQGLQKVA